MVNKVILIGHLGDNPTSTTFPDGSMVSNFSLATSEHWKDKQTGELKESTEWHRVVTYGGLAKVVAEYAKKGTQVYVEGKLRTRKWQDKNGQDRYTVEIVANEFRLLGRKEQNQGVQTTENAPQHTQSNVPTPEPQPQATVGNFDDEVPF